MKFKHLNVLIFHLTSGMVKFSHTRSVLLTYFRTSSLNKNQVMMYRAVHLILNFLSFTKIEIIYLSKDNFYLSTRSNIILSDMIGLFTLCCLMCHPAEHYFCLIIIWRGWIWGGSFFIVMCCNEGFIFPITLNRRGIWVHPFTFYIC